MYEDSWYSFLPDTANSKEALAAQSAGHRRRESLLQQPNGSTTGAGAVRPLSDLLEEAVDSNTPPEASVIRRAKSCSHFEDVARPSRHEGRQSKLQKKRKLADRSWNALDLQVAQEPALDDSLEHLLLPGPDRDLLLASQHEYLLYRDQLVLTERHLDSLIADTDSTLELLEDLTQSFRSVDEQTTHFRAQCEDLLSEQKRLQDLADEVGTELYYYTYLDNATRRLNAPGASKLVDDGVFVEILDTIDMCIAFMAKNPTYRDAESYQARYQALLTKALHLLEVGFTNRLDRVSAEIYKQIAATKSESAWHALAYGRFEEMMLDSYSLVPNVQKVILSAYDQLGNAKHALTFDIYSNTANGLFQSYLAARDRILKPVVQRGLDTFKSEAKSSSVETAARNFTKQCLENSYLEAILFSKLFRIDPKWSADGDSAYVAMKSHQRAVMNGTNITPLATNLQLILQTANLQTACNVVGWITNEYVLAEYDEDETLFTTHCRELAERLLTDNLWKFTDALFEAELAKTVSKAPVVVDALKLGPAVDGRPWAEAYSPIKRALELLAMFDQCMPKERCQRNSPVVFKIVRESIAALQRAETRLKSIKNGADPDLFMIKNLLILRNELVALEIGDIRNQDDGRAAMQHFGQIWDALSPQNWVGFIGSFIPGTLWPVGGSSKPATPVPGGAGGAGAAAAAANARPEDAGEQLDQLLRQAIYGFTRRWGQLLHEARGGDGGSGGRVKLGGSRNLVKLERELDDTLRDAFGSQPEVVAKLREAIQANVAQAQEAGAKARNGGKGGGQQRR